ncbi:MAG: aminodeoxychorismate/anthranilate synthase component II [Acidobacteria bacterium]|nr:aminodeoxychorismate/anthranilate synthase component II [Acidobacteriota bacterium]MCY3966064.1 aminodeoxychorismate/anthranilate synthase component II [Acidobacteriota bacterium]
MILVIDNYDSFTYNLVQMLGGIGAELEVVRNDVETVPELLARRPDGIVLSPGPGRPEDAGVCIDLLRARPDVPLLGVCLGHQALGSAFGGTVSRARVLMHGKTSEVEHGGVGVLAGLPSPFVATRYHSLAVEEDSLPGTLEPLAWSEDGTLMAMRHRELPYWGVQFHPESVLTDTGPDLLQNFLDICEAADD